MPLKRSRGVLPFMVLAVGLFRLQFAVNFCGVSSMSSPHHRGGVRHVWFWPKKKSKQPIEPVALVRGPDTSIMTVGAVSQWLITLGLGKYQGQFQEAGVDGLLLRNLTDEDLQEMGIDRGIHRKKILVHRDEWVSKKSKIASSRNLWRPMINDSKPDVLVQQFAPALLEHMKKEGMDMAPPQEALVNELDNIFADKLEQRDYLNTLEAANSILWSHTAHGNLGGKCLREEIAGDLHQISKEGHELQERIMGFSSNVQQFAFAMITYAKRMQNPISESEKKDIDSQFEKHVQKWKASMKDLAEKASFCTERLSERLSARWQSELPGGSAVQANLQTFSELIQEREQAAEQCKRLYNLADRDFQLALAARSGGLEEMIQHEREDCRKLQEQEAHLWEQRNKYETLRKELQQMHAEQRNSTHAVRPVLLQQVGSWWSKMSHQDMAGYESKVREDEAVHQRVLQDIAAKVAEIDVQLQALGKETAAIQEKIADLKWRNSREFWKNILTELIVEEEKLKENSHQLELIQDQLLKAMKETGVADPALAANLLTQHERSKTLLSEARRAVSIQEWVDEVDLTIHDSSSLGVLGFALLSLRDAHQVQSRSRKKVKTQILQRLMDSTSDQIQLKHVANSATILVANHA